MYSVVHVFNLILDSRYSPALCLGSLNRLDTVRYEHLSDKSLCIIKAHDVKESWERERDNELSSSISIKLPSFEKKKQRGDQKGRVTETGKE